MIAIRTAQNEFSTPKDFGDFASAEDRVHQVVGPEPLYRVISSTADEMVLSILAEQGDLELLGLPPGEGSGNLRITTYKDF